MCSWSIHKPWKSPKMPATSTSFGLDSPVKCITRTNFPSRSRWIIVLIEIVFSKSVTASPLQRAGTSEPTSKPRIVPQIPPDRKRQTQVLKGRLDDARTNPSARFAPAPSRKRRETACNGGQQDRSGLRHARRTEAPRAAAGGAGLPERVAPDGVVGGVHDAIVIAVGRGIRRRAETNSSTRCSPRC